MRVSQSLPPDVLGVGQIADLNVLSSLLFQVDAVNLNPDPLKSWPFDALPELFTSVKSC